MKIAYKGNANNFVKTLFTVMFLVCLLALLVSPASAQTGWAVGDKGTLLFTTDGTTWDPQPLKTPTANLNSVFSLDGKTAYAVGDSLNPGKEPGTILYWDGTLNGKKEQIWAAQTEGVEKVNLHEIFFADATNGFVAGDGGVILYTSGDGKWAQKGKGATTQNLNSVYAYKVKDAYRGVAVGAKGAIVYTSDGTNWKAATIEGKPGGDFRSVRRIYNPGTKKYHLSAVGDSGVYSSTDGGANWTKQKKQPGVLTKPMVVRNYPGLNTISVWVGQTGNNDIFQWDGTTWSDTSFKDFGDVYGMFIGDGAVWITGADGKIGRRYNLKWELMRNPKDDKDKLKLNGIRMFPGKKKSQVDQDTATSPDSGISGVNALSTIAHGIPAGNINAANIVISLSGHCQGEALAMTPALSIVSGSGDSKLISFLLPSGLDPGKYFISISDSEDGDANFESSNCAVVDVVQ